MKEKKCESKGFKRIWTLFLAVVVIITLFPVKPVEAATPAGREQFKQELIHMIESADLSSHYIYSYRLLPSEVNTIFQEIKADNNTKWMVAAYYSNLSVGYAKKGKYASEIALTNVDSAALARYKRLEANVAKIKAGIEPKMTDIDKVMYLHDSIVELASYKYVAYQSYGAGGILGDRVGVCAGYTKALNLLLADQGIQAVYMSSDAIDHGWTAVYLDGQWYHIDSTWDDTRSAKSGLTSRKFFLRNDSEFITNDKNSHVSWEPWNYSNSVISTSTKYKNWYVHDIVGKMAFEDGYWYYVDTKSNSIMQNTAEGGSEKVILDCNGKSIITLVDATSAGITYKQDGVTKNVGYKGEKQEAKEEESTVIEPIVEATGTKVYVLLQLETNGLYKQVGTGLIKSGQTSKDPKVVVNDIISVSDLSQYVSDNQYVFWVGISKNGKGNFYLKGIVRNK